MGLSTYGTLIATLDKIIKISNEKTRGATQEK